MVVVVSADVSASDTAKDVEADPETTPANVTDNSDAVISSSEPQLPPTNGNGEADGVSQEAVASVEEAVQSEVIVQPDDDLLREMEEMEGDKKSSEEASPEEAADREAVQETSDLLKELENDVGESSEVAKDVQLHEEAECSEVTEPANVVEAAKESPDASCVDSTTEPALGSSEGPDAVLPSPKKPNPSASVSDLAVEVDAVDVPVNIATTSETAAPAEPAALEEESPMDVDDEQPEPTVEEPIEKDEAISSTSSDEIREIPAIEITEVNAEPNETPATNEEAESAVATSQTTSEPKDEAVTSSEDLPDAPSNEADSSETNADVPAKATIADDDDDMNATRPSDATATGDELNQTLDTESKPRNADKAENKVLTNMMNNGSSTPHSNPVSAAATPNVFNSTPISKQFEISSENVSKIDEHSGAGLASNNVSSQDDLKSSDVLTTFSGESLIFVFLGSCISFRILFCALYAKLYLLAHRLSKTQLLIF